MGRVGLKWNWGQREEDQQDRQVDGDGRTEREPSRRMTTRLSPGVSGDAVAWDGEEVVDAGGGQGVGLKVHILGVYSAPEWPCQ